MKILITGNPNYAGLAHGLSTVLKDHDLMFLSRSLGNNLLDVSAIAEYSKDFDVFINNTYIPNNGQLALLDAVYSVGAVTQIVNVSSTSVYWENIRNIDYYSDKCALEQRSKFLSNQCAEHGNSIRISCIAYGMLDSESKRVKSPDRNKIDLIVAAKYIGMLIESDRSINIPYICLDPIQKAI